MKLVVPVISITLVFDAEIATPHLLGELFAKLLVPLKLSAELLDPKVAPPHLLAQLLKKLLVSSAVLLDAPPNLACYPSY